MTRSHKYNDRPRGDLSEGYSPDDNLPKFFSKNGYADSDPKKTKKNGNGKGNWGTAGEEVLDDPAAFNFANARRRSNSSSMTSDVRHFKTKFDVNEPEPVFEEDLHGPLDDESTDGSVDFKN